MRRSRTNLAVFSLIVLALGAQTGRAQVQSKAQQACINALAAGTEKAAQLQAKQNLACLKGAGRGTLSDGVEACVTGDPNRKAASLLAKIQATETKKCSTLPAFAYSGAATVASAGQKGRLQTLIDLLGTDPDSDTLACAASPAGCACQSAVAKAASKLGTLEAKLFLKCAKKVLKDGAAAASEVAKCVTDAATEGALAAPASTTKIDKALAKLTGVIVKACDDPGVTSAAWADGACSSLGGASLASCIHTQLSCRTCQTLNEAYALNVDCDAFDDGTTNASCLPTVCFDGCAFACRTVVDDPAVALFDATSGMVCGDPCVAVSNLTPPCGADCGGVCDFGETCIDDECQCHMGTPVCLPPFPTVPECATDDRSTCEFLVGTTTATPPYHYSLLQVDGYQDSDTYFYVDFRGLLPDATGYTPYVADCDASKGTFKVPGDSSQASHFAAGGLIMNFEKMALATNRDPRCSDPDFRPLIRSQDISNKGYYIKFTPNPGEVGTGYNHMTFVLDPADSDGRFEVVYVSINVLPAPLPQWWKTPTPLPTATPTGGP